MTYQTVNPATEEILANYQYFSDREVEAILKKAEASFSKWRKTSLPFRSQVLRKIAQKLKTETQAYAQVISKEMGKPIQDSLAEVKKSATACEYYADHLEEFLQSKDIKTDFEKSWVSYQPLGPLLGIMPWNYPFWQSFRFLAPNLAAGNVIVLKPSDITTETGALLEKLIHDSVIEQDASFASYPIYQNLRINHEQCAKVIADPRVKAASFTGSTRGGREIAVQCAQHLKKSVLELGGSDAYIVTEDADWSSTIKNCVATRLVNNGQSCVAGKRFIVHEKIIQKFISDFKAEMSNYKIGSPEDSTTKLGPLAHKKFLHGLQKSIQDLTSGAKNIHLISSDQILPEKGHYIRPQILHYQSEHESFFKEEFFGPVALVCSYKTMDEAFSLVNRCDYGLGGGLFAASGEQAAKLLQDQMEAGFVVANSYVKSDARLPFGGVKNSGYGRELGRHGFYEFVNIKTVAIGKV